MTTGNGRVVFRLREIMQQRGLSIRALSKIAGLSRPTIRDIRNNAVSGVALLTLEKLCSALDVGIGVLVVFCNDAE